jgi:CO/xanthine dehydrogenase Mo-binding subunit
MATILEDSGFDPERKLRVVGTAPVKHDGADKVTGRAKFGADLMMPGMLVGKILRSPHPHAVLRSIDISKAEALAGVMAVVTREDFPGHAEGSMLGDMTRNSMAREKVFYEGHAVAGVAAISETIAKEALKLIHVDYEILPHVIDPVEAMKAGAPILHDHLRTKGMEGVADKRTNVVERLEFGMGDVEAHHRARIHDQCDPPGLHRAARLRRALYRRWPGGAVVLHAGPFRVPRSPFRDAEHSSLQGSRHSIGAWRRVRRQDDHVCRARGSGAVTQGQAAGEDRADAQ